MNPRQIDLEGGALPGLAVDPDAAAALLDNAVDRSQAKPRALSYPLGGKEGLKDAGLGLRVHAQSGIGQREHDVGTWSGLEVLLPVARVQLEVGRLDGEPPAPGHGIARIDRQIHDDL